MAKAINSACRKGGGGQAERSDGRVIDWGPCAGFRGRKTGLQRRGILGNRLGFFGKLMVCTRRGVTKPAAEDSALV